MKDGFLLFASWFESKRHCFAMLVSGRLTKDVTRLRILGHNIDVRYKCYSPPVSLREFIMFVAFLFRPMKCSQIRA